MPLNMKQSIDKAGIEAGLEAAKVDHPAELHVKAISADGGTVELSLVGRFAFMKAALWGSYSKDKGKGIGADIAIPIGKP